MAYEALFEPIKVGGVTLKNRIVLCAMGGTALLGFGNKLEKGIKDYYIERCKGGVGLIIPGVMQVVEGKNHLYDNEELFMREVKPIMDEIHSYGTKYFIQLGAGFGRANFVGLDGGNEELLKRFCVAPSDGLPNVWNPSVKHRGLTREEIYDIIDSYGKSALMCKKAGIDGVEIHAVHEGYLLDQFAVANTNHRTDEFGGSLENRLRFACLVIKEIKKTCGEDFPVSVRYSVASKMRGFNAGALPGENYAEFGRSMEESPAAARMLEAAGADMLNADNGSYDSWWWAHPPVYMPLHCNFPEVSYIKKFVNIPVFCAGRMEEPEFAANAVATGQIDGIGVARQFLADPHWVNKIKEGRPQDVKPCIACHNGCFPISLFMKPGMGFKMAHCAINPAAREEGEWVLTPASKNKNIAVVGGGIGGMECARLLTMRGHRVTLFEKSGELGGAFIAASAPSFKEKDKELLAWYKRELKKLQIDVRLNTEVTEETLKAYDETVIATGSKARSLPVPGADLVGVMGASEYLRGGKTGEKVVIIGGGLTGCEIAYDLALKGKKPVIVEMQENILELPGLCAANYNMLREIIRYYNIEVLTSSPLKKIEKSAEGLTVTVTKDGGEAAIAADNVILCVGYVPENSLAGKLPGAQVIGDARQVGNLMSVIADAYKVGYCL